MQHTNKLNTKQQHPHFDLFYFHSCSLELPAAAVEKELPLSGRRADCATTRQGLSW